jgi:tRNA threonylcarbamoyl adenosine modification protein YeaZ
MILAIESASSDLSVALTTADGRPIATAGWHGDQRQGNELLPRLLALLQREGRSLQEASAVAVGIGPGSFTGLRVGMSLAKGLAFGLGRPIVGIPSLEAWLAEEPRAEAAIVSVGAREAYLVTRRELAPRIVDRDALGAMVAALVAPTELAEAFGLESPFSPLAGAQAVARLGARRLAEQPAGDDLSDLEPRYLRAPRGIGQAATGGIEWR